MWCPLEGFESGGVGVFGVLGGLIVGDDDFACLEVDVRDGGAVARVTESDDLMFNLATVLDVMLVFGLVYLMVGVLWLIFAAYYQTKSEF